jgi:hypothetical protein
VGRLTQRAAHVNHVAAAETEVLIEFTCTVLIESFGSHLHSPYGIIWKFVQFSADVSSLLAQAVPSSWAPQQAGTCVTWAHVTGIGTDFGLARVTGAATGVTWAHVTAVQGPR